MSIGARIIMPDVALARISNGSFDLTDVQVEGLVKRLPAELVAKLREGPWPEPYCGVCRSILDFANGEEDARALTLIDFHDRPRRECGRYSSTREREVYERCMQIYRAAGWTDGS